jgi:hypothetical protein
MPGSFNDPKLLSLLLNLSVVTFAWSIRWKAIYTTLIFALPELFGYIWAGKSILRSIFGHRIDNNLDLKSPENNRNVLRVLLWGFGASWMLWYVAMSMYWVRYIFPAYFIGIIFVSALVSEHTNGYDIKLTFRRTAALLLKREINYQNMQAGILFLVFSLALGFSIGTYRIQMTPSIWNPEAAAAYLRGNIANGSKVETYESELFFLAPELNYNFPPDLISMELYWRANIDRQYPIDYDPLNSKPEYLVIGPYAESWGVYDQNLIRERFELKAIVGGYQIYKIKNSQSNS